MWKPDSDGRWWLRSVAGEGLGYIKKDPLMTLWIAYDAMGKRLGSRKKKTEACQMVRDAERPNSPKRLFALEKMLGSFFG
jgi:hypothetical protein